MTQLSERELQNQKRWDAHFLSLHAGSSKSTDECIREVSEKLGLRPGGTAGIPR